MPQKVYIILWGGIKITRRLSPKEIREAEYDLCFFEVTCAEKHTISLYLGEAKTGYDVPATALSRKRARLMLTGKPPKIVDFYHTYFAAECITVVSEQVQASNSSK